jgi:hypothetical protein
LPALQQHSIAIVIHIREADRRKKYTSKGLNDFEEVAQTPLESTAWQYNTPLWLLQHRVVIGHRHHSHLLY